MPTPMAGLGVTALAAGLDHPRWVYVLPNGDVLVAESNAPPKPEDGKGIKGYVHEKSHGPGRRRCAHAPTASPCCAIPTATARPKAAACSWKTSTRPSAWRWSATIFTWPIPMPSCAFPTSRARPASPRRPVKLVDLPAGPINHHWTKNIIASADGSKLYVTVGSNSNVGESGMEAEAGRAAIWEVDAKTGEHRVFASGLRNPNGMGWAPATGALWTVVNERDEIGSDLVPDYLTSVTRRRVLRLALQLLRQPRGRPRPGRRGPTWWPRRSSPDYALGSHVAPLGLAFSEGKRCRPRWRAACSSANTAPGTACRTAATRWCLCPSRTACRRASRSTC